MSDNINRLSYSGTSEQMFKLWTMLLLRNILCLGFYTFWSKTILRQFIAQHFTLAGTQFNYIGNAKQLYKGFFLVYPFWLVLLIGFKLSEHTPYEVPFLLFLLVVVVFFTFVGLYSSLRYRICNIEWSGLHGHMQGSAWKYALISSLYHMIALCSLGLLCGWMDHNLYKIKLNNMSAGDLQVSYHGKALDLLKINCITLLLAIPTLWLSRIWYIACLRRYIYNNTYIGEFKIINTERGIELVKLYVWGFFVTVCSLGILYPFVIQRKLHYIATYFAIEGKLDQMQLHADAATIQKTGEGLYAVMDAEHDL